MAFPFFQQNMENIDADVLADQMFSLYHDFCGQFEQDLGQRQTPRSQGSTRTLKPSVDVYEDTENNLVTVTFEFPGIAKEDIQVNVENSKLVVSAENKRPIDGSGKYIVQERRVGKYLRSVQLPQGTKSEDVFASADNGLLTVIFPKASAEQAPKKVVIS